LARIRIAGAGLAGSAAALAAMQCGAAVRLWDPSRVPKHKVCGEFLTPEIRPVLERLQLWDAFLDQQPARMERMRLVFGHRSANGRFAEPAYGLSRYRLDALLRGEAEARGAQIIAERVPGIVDITAHGRQFAAAGKDRLFGFKAHFQGPVSDAVELYFFNGFYIGVNPVEGGLTNVCGIGPEEGLRRHGFDYDALVHSNVPLRERLNPLQREMNWLSTGPLLYQTRLPAPPMDTFLAGDALQFVDPFTGTGMAIAIWSGSLAGKAAAEGLPTAEYYTQIRSGVEKQYGWCGRLRSALSMRFTQNLAPYIPPSWLYALTRPQIESR
jgi:flavin-dependent dehydrogenase